MRPLRAGVAMALLLTVACKEAAVRVDGSGGGSDAPEAVDSAPRADAPDAPPATAALLDEAIRTCTWTTGCLNAEDGEDGGAPNANVSSCLATFFDQRAQPVSELRLAPWGEYRACTAAATDCASFRTCLLASAAICGDVGAFEKGVECPDGTRSCDDVCLGTCSGTSLTCSGDRARLQYCDGATQYTAHCDMGPPGGACGAVGPSANCLPGTIGTCAGATSITCDGTTSVLCAGGVEARFDCASAGQTCGASTGCQDGGVCTSTHTDACTGNVLAACLSGNPRDIDCASLGGTCGTLASGGAGCVFP